MRQYLIGVFTLMALLSSQRLACSQTIAPEFKADIERLMEISGAASLGEQMANLASSSVLEAMKAQSDVPDRVFVIVREVLRQEFAKAFTDPDGIRAKQVELYAKYFTHEEVRGLLAFYQTDVGKKAIKVLPALVQEGAAIGQEWATANMPRMLMLLETRLRAEGFIP
jgi:uncharacterized protein